MSLGAEQIWSVKAELSKELALARERSGRTASDVTAAKIASRTKLWRMEAGIGPWKVSDVGELADLYGVSPQHRELLRDMARASEDDAFTEKHSASRPPRFSLYLRMEARATALTAVSGEGIHGLAQTEEYHQALQATWPSGDAQEKAAGLKLRQERQEDFWDRNDVAVTLIMSEGALVRRTAPEDVMQRQFERLRTLASRRGVEIRYVPLTHPVAPALQGPFTLIKTAAGVSAYIEAPDGGRILSNPRTVTAYEAAANIAEGASRDIKEWQ